MNPTPAFHQSDFGIVSTMHILSSGEIVSSLAEYQKVEDRFSWVDRSYIVSKILQLRKLTDDTKRSVIVIYEEGHMIKEYINVEHAFKPLAFC
jgi:hypothetical protein